MTGKTVNTDYEHTMKKARQVILNRLVDGAYPVTQGEPVLLSPEGNLPSTEWVLWYSAKYKVGLVQASIEGIALLEYLNSQTAPQGTVSHD